MAYGSNTSSCGTDTFVFVKGGYTVSHESANLRIGGSDSFSKVVTLELSDGTIHTVLFAKIKFMQMLSLKMQMVTFTLRI